MPTSDTESKSESEPTSGSSAPIEESSELAAEVRDEVRGGLVALTSPEDGEHVRATVRSAVGRVRDTDLTGHALGRGVLEGTLDAVGSEPDADQVVAAAIRHLVAAAAESHVHVDDVVAGAVDAASEREPRLIEVVESASVEAYRAAGIVRGDRPRASE